MRHALSVLVFVLLACTVSFAGEHDEDVDAAVAAARSWLELVDAGDYAASWQLAAEYFKQAVTEEQWQQAMQAVREPLGEVVSREVSTTTYTTELPAAPDGEYVVIQLDTTFANKRDAVETVTPMKQDDGTWRVSGYFIK